MLKGSEKKKTRKISGQMKQCDVKMAGVIEEDALDQIRWKLKTLPRIVGGEGERQENDDVMTRKI